MMVCKDGSIFYFTERNGLVSNGVVMFYDERKNFYSRPGFRSVSYSGIIYHDNNS